MFVIEEKNNSIDLTDKGIAHLSGDNEDHFFVLPDMGIEVGKIDAKDLSPEEKAREKLMLHTVLTLSDLDLFYYTCRKHIYSHG